VDLTEILRTLAMFFAHGQVTELRALEVSTKGRPRPYTVSGYFDDVDQLAHEAEKLTRVAKGVYVVPNVVDPALLARAANRVHAVDREPLTSDANIQQRRWLLLDADPVRPAGISSTDHEHAAGLARVQEIQAALTESGWPEGALADSGNGGHLLYRLELPNDDASRTLLEHVLQALAFRFNDAAVTIDQTVFNAARIWKLYGTVARKGDSTRDRPHRTSQLLDVPEAWAVVTLDQLEALSRQRPEPVRDPRASPRRGTGEAFDLDQWIADHGLDLIGPLPWRDGRKWIFPICPWNEEHRNRSAYIIQLANGAIGARCHHNSCAGRDWPALRDLVEPNRRMREQTPTPRGRREGGEGPTTPSTGSSASQNGQALPDAARPEPSLQTWLNTEFPKSDQLNAEFLVQLHGHDLRYCHPWKRWLVWDGRRWQVDATTEVMRRAKSTLHRMLVATEFINDKKEFSAWMGHLQGSFSTGHLKGMVELAQSEPGIPVLPDALDGDLWALNCLNGVVVLQTGAFRPHHRKDLFTKQVPVAYDPDASCPRWEQFLQEIFRKDQALITFIQRAVGYSLTGDTQERALFICFGTGRNGKSTFLEIVAELLSDYAMRTPTRTLMEKRNLDQIPNDVAALKGRRFVHASESGEGQRLDEEFIKDATGRDTLAARFLHGEWFNFRPEFKLWLRTNHRPVIRGTDPAIWDRPRLIPFVERFEGREDKQLPATLRGEFPGILRWAVQGCLSWQINGLPTPDAVHQATETYRKDMDVIGDFLADCCTLAPYASVTSKDLTAAYTHWCDQNNEHPINSKAFGGRLVERGCQSGKGTHGARLWRGIGLVDRVSED
jgi:P4 family phage/plasmid primase-like protien